VSGGERVYLEAVKLPSGYATSIEALKRFIARLSAGIETAARPPVALADSDLIDAVDELDRDKV